MIYLNQDDPIYDYELRSMILAFFPQEKISAQSGTALFELTVSYMKDSVTARIGNDERTVFCDTFTKTRAKNPIKRLVYGLLKDYSGKELPWGTLTGIRPTKIAMELLNAKESIEEIQEEYQETYCASEQKAKLCTEVAIKEQQLLSSISFKDTYSLYIGIPFCRSRCLYCSFTSFSISQYESQVDEYLDALFKEMDHIVLAEQHKQLVDIYIGGGTPTSLNERQLERLLKKVGTSFSLDTLIEYTVEAGRPDTITKEKLQIMRANGVTRISINPQTMKDDTLKLVGRNHTVQETIDSYYEARSVGFDNINMDIIVGLPGETIDDVHHTMEAILQLSPESLTVHSLAIKRAANLNTQYDTYKKLVKGSTNEMLTLVHDYATKLGMEPYYLYRQKNIPGNLENIGYAIPGKESIYNILIMEEKHNIIGIGAGSSSKYIDFEKETIDRVENVKDVNHYINRIDEMILRKVNR